MKIIFIGAGNLATRLAIEMYNQSFNILQIYSRTLDSAQSLAKQTNSQPINDLAKLSVDADIYIFSVKDSILISLLNQMPRTKGIWIHTAGSLPMDIFKNLKNNYGVLYPFQTFSKNREVDFKTIPFFVESNNDQTLEIIKKIASKLTNRVVELSSEKRQYLHLTGVFACNFVNHMYTIAEHILEKQDLSFELILPLICETASKVHGLSPKEAQTGPAIRYDKNVINKHLELLEDSEFKEVYNLLSENIFKVHNK